MSRARPTLSRLLALLLLLQWSTALAAGLRPLASASLHGLAVCLAEPMDAPAEPAPVRHDFCSFCSAPAELPPAPPVLRMVAVHYAVVFALGPVAVAPPPPRAPPQQPRAPPLA